MILIVPLDLRRAVTILSELDKLGSDGLEMLTFGNSAKYLRMMSGISLNIAEIGQQFDKWLIG